MDALKQRFLDARSGAKQGVEAAERARAAGDFVAAVDAYKAALRLTPGDPALKKALGEVERLASARVAETRRKQALLEERYGHWKEAAVSWQRVLDARPDDRQAKERLQVALERSGAARR
jgi:cytochrome c-type biogenesis protein CcmH/NrfG